MVNQYSKVIKQRIESAIQVQIVAVRSKYQLRGIVKDTANLKPIL